MQFAATSLRARSVYRDLGARDEISARGGCSLISHALLKKRRKVSDRQ
jgi:hypothetical protein